MGLRRSTRILRVAPIVIAGCLAAVGLAQQSQPTTPADDGQWVMATKDYQNIRYSTLDQINTENAKDLKLAWTFSNGVKRGQEAAPVVIGDTMYIVTPFPNFLYALDLNNKGR